MTSSNIRLLPGLLLKAAAPFPLSYVSTDFLGPLTAPARIVKFTNNSNADVYISWDGVNDHEIIPTGSFLLLDISSNKEQERQLYIPEGTMFYYRGVSGAGSTG